MQQGENLCYNGVEFGLCTILSSLGKDNGGILFELALSEQLTKHKGQKDATLFAKWVLIEIAHKERVWPK